MFITSAVSHRRGWAKFGDAHAPTLAELREVLRAVDVDHLREAQAVKTRIHVSIRPDSVPPSAVDHMFESRGWAIGTRIPAKYPRHHWPRVDYAKDGVMVELGLYGREGIESMLHATFPAFYQAGRWGLGVLLVLTAEVARQMEPQVGTFETIQARLETADPLQLRTPTVVAAVSAGDRAFVAHELTSEIDDFLLATINLSLDQAIERKEQQNYDFKEQLPRDLSATVCAMANEPGGGIVILGVSDGGAKTGIGSHEIDAAGQTVANQVKNRCRPVPEVGFLPFPIPDTPGKFICVIPVRETKQDPCMVEGKVYVRMGATNQPAGPEKLREIFERLRNGPTQRS